MDQEGSLGDALSEDGRDETANERADRNWEELMQELRVMQTGTQVLSGFLLAVAFQPRFTELDPLQVGLYLVLVGLAALATILALAPVGMHRSLFGRRQKPELVRMAARLVKADLVVVGILSVGVTVLIVDFTLDRTFAVVVLILGSIIVVSLWLVLPLLVSRGAERDARAHTVET
ncbi:DUF6328 family protein [Microbacterium sp. A196]|uniref:DUF6328 family protein n=1 Tax=unclassified Microbacterium TaxID=2609290 RepID=UPI003FD063D5